MLNKPQVVYFRYSDKIGNMKLDGFLCRLVHPQTRHIQLKAVTKFGISLHHAWFRNYSMIYKTVTKLPHMNTDLSVTPDVFIILMVQNLECLYDKNLQ